MVIDPSSSSTQHHSLLEGHSNVLAVTTNTNEVIVPAARNTEPHWRELI